MMGKNKKSAFDEWNDLIGVAPVEVVYEDEDESEAVEKIDPARVPKPEKFEVVAEPKKIDWGGLLIFFSLAMMFSLGLWFNNIVTTLTGIGCLMFLKYFKGVDKE